MTKREGMIKALQTMTDEEIDILDVFLHDCKDDYLDVVGEACDEAIAQDEEPSYTSDDIERIDVLLHALLKTRYTDIGQ